MEIKNEYTQEDESFEVTLNRVRMALPQNIELRKAVIIQLAIEFGIWLKDESQTQPDDCGYREEVWADFIKTEPDVSDRS